MNFEQLQDWLTKLNSLNKKEMSCLEVTESCVHFLRDNVQSTEILSDFLAKNYVDQELSEPIFGLLLASYFRGGILRQFTLQLLPTLIATYLIALAQHQRQSVSMLETLLLGIYNEEILTGGVTGSFAKRQDVVRIPSLRNPSIYHDPGKISQSVLADNSLLDRLTAPSGGGNGGENVAIQHVATIGPYPVVDRLSAETRFLILGRLLTSVNNSLAQFHRAPVCKALCRAGVVLCHSGFRFPKSDMLQKVLGLNDITNDGSEDMFSVVDDFYSRPRVVVNPTFLLELLNGVYFSLFNGVAELAIRALDAIYQRSLFEMFPDVLLVCNAIINSLLENPSGTPKEEEPMGIRIVPGAAIDPDWKHRRVTITNASLRMKRMPEDIPIKEPGEPTSMCDDSRKDESSLRKKLSSLRVDNLTPSLLKSHSALLDMHTKRRRVFRKSQHDTLPELDESTATLQDDRSAIPADEYLSDEATITNNVIERLVDEEINRFGMDKSVNGIVPGQKHRRTRSQEEVVVCGNGQSFEMTYLNS